MKIKKLVLILGLVGVLSGYSAEAGKSKSSSKRCTSVKSCPRGYSISNQCGGCVFGSGTRGSCSSIKSANGFLSFIYKESCK